MTAPDHPPAAGSQAAPPRSWARRLAPLTILALILVLFFAFGLNRYVGFGALRDNRALLTGFVAAHAALAGLIFIAAYIVAVAASLPGGAVLSVLAGFLFGTWVGTACVLVGATIGATLLFLAARSAFGDGLRRRLGARGERLAHDLDQNAFSYLLVLRLVPLFPFWLVNLVPALTRMSLGAYMLATLLGIIPGSFVFVSIGSGLGALFDRGETPNLGIIFSPDILVPLCGLAVLAMIPVAYRRFRRQRTAA